MPGRVLLLGPEEANRRTARQILDGEGHSVREAADVVEAKVLLANGTFDVIVSESEIPSAALESLDLSTEVVVAHPWSALGSECSCQAAFDGAHWPTSEERLLQEIERALQLKSVDDERVRLAEENRRYRENLEQQVAERTAALRVSNRALAVLSQCNAALVRATEEVRLLEEVCRLLVEVGGYRLAWVGVAEFDKQYSVRPVAQAGYEEGYLDSVTIRWSDTELGAGPTGTAIRSGQTVVARDIHTNPDYAPWRQAAEERGYSSSIALPLTRDTIAFGALNIYASRPDAFDEEELRLLERLADDLAFGVMGLRASERHRRALVDQARLAAAIEQAAEAVLIPA